MEVISEFRNLRNKAGFKPHETIEVVFQGNTDFLNFAK
jgi:hypothetical protein